MVRMARLKHLFHQFCFCLANCATTNKIISYSVRILHESNKHVRLITYTWIQLHPSHVHDAAARSLAVISMFVVAVMSVRHFDNNYLPSREHNDEQECPAVADKTARRETMPKIAPVRS